jgi:hypothetical protein
MNTFLLVATFFVALASAQRGRINNTCIDNKLDSLHNTVYDTFDKIAALRHISGATILSYTNESAEIMMVYSRFVVCLTIESSNDQDMNPSPGRKFH